MGAGKNRDFAEVYAEHKEVVFRVALSLVGNPNDAEDVTQEVFMQVYKSLKGFSGKSKLSTWLYRITVRVSSKWLSRQRAQEGVEFMKQGQGKIDEHLNLDLFRALHKLPFNSRVIIGLILVLGLSHAEAAEVLNIPEGTVASRLHKARKLLAQVLQPKLSY